MDQHQRINQTSGAVEYYTPPFIVELLNAQDELEKARARIRELEAIQPSKTHADPP